MINNLEQYCNQYSQDENELQITLREMSISNSGADHMRSDTTQAMLLRFIADILKPKCIVEIGSFTCYATAFLADSLPKDSQLFTLEKDKSMIGYFQKLKNYYPNKHIHQLLGDALETLNHWSYPKIDLLFIDAQKSQYIQYLQAADKYMPIGSIIIADNVLWKGKVIDSQHDKMTTYLHQFNEYIKQSGKYTNFILNYRDGLNIIKKIND